MLGGVALLALADAVPLSRPRQAAGADYYPYRDLLNCDGANFSKSWRDWRQLVGKNAEQGFPYDEELLRAAYDIYDEYKQDALISSMTHVRVLVRQAEVTKLRNFCLLGYASALFLMFRHEFHAKYLADLANVMGWGEWPLDFSESSDWPTFWRMVPVHMEKLLTRTNWGFTVEEKWGREEHFLPKPTVEEVERALCTWLGTSRPVWKAPELKTKLRHLRLLVAGHHTGSSMEPYTMLRRVA